MNAVDTALSYLRAGLSVLPARLADKRPALSAWKPFQTTLPGEQQVRVWFENAEALCIVTGAVSKYLELLDFDQRGELFQAWCARVREADPTLLDLLVVETSPSGGWHVVYRCASPVCGNLKLAQRKVFVPSVEPVVIQGKRFVPRKEPDGRFSVLLTLIETRGEGGLFLCAPSPGYEMCQGDFTQLPILTAEQRDVMLEAAWSLNEFIPEPEKIAQTSSSAAQRPGDDFNQRGDVQTLLIKHGWSLVKSGENEYWRRPGKDRGWSATLKNGVLYVFSSNAAPFESEKAYTPFSVYARLEHGGNFGAAAAALRADGFGGDDGDVNISALVAHAPVECETTPPGPVDPGPLPDALLRAPGFISELMDHCLATAPYPNHVMAFCGALSFQAFLAGRKVRDAGGNRTNIYLLGLAHSATGKDWPRKLNMKIAHQVGLSRGVAERFASGEGLQDALFTDPCMLFQTDEIDGMFRQVNGAHDARYENIITQLLMMYSSAGTVFPMRKLAKQEHRVIDQPCLVLFGTAIPNHYYDALSSRMLTNGLFARMMVLESGPRSKGKDAVDIDPPPRVLATAKWWADFSPGSGNLRDWHPVPLVVEQTEEARRFLTENREQAEAEYTAAEKLNDALGTTVWGRVDEQIRKLALLHAISTDHENPRIDLPSVTWARDLTMHQTRRMLFMARNYVAENPFEADCLKLVRKLREAGGVLPHSVALKNMHLPAESFVKLIQTMEQRGEVENVSTSTSGRPTRQYRLIGV